MLIRVRLLSFYLKLILLPESFTFLSYITIDQIIFFDSKQVLYDVVKGKRSLVSEDFGELLETEGKLELFSLFDFLWIEKVFLGLYKWVKIFLVEMTTVWMLFFLDRQFWIFLFIHFAGTISLKPFMLLIRILNAERF